MVVCTSLENVGLATLVADVKSPVTCPMDRRAIDVPAKINNARLKRAQDHEKGLDYVNEPKHLRLADILTGGCILQTRADRAMGKVRKLHRQMRAIWVLF